MKIGLAKKGTKGWFAEQEDDAKMKRLLFQSTMNKNRIILAGK
jgi:hypothetical protein